MEPAVKKVLFIVQHRFNRSPGQRYRCEQYIKYLTQHGFECTYSPLIANGQEDNALYNSANKIDKAVIFFKGIYRRIKDVLRSHRYDIVFIYREAFMTGSVFFEKQLKRSGVQIILDFDDAIWLSTVSEANKSLQWLKRPEKVNDIIKLSNLVITGNSYLAAYASRFNHNVVVFPSTIDLNYYKLPLKANMTDKITIGWSGSHTTVEHFETILPVFRMLKEKYCDKIQFAVYGDPNYVNAELGIQGTAWSAESEVVTIASFDVGIMPLPDNEWSKGKCAMKGLQYMGLEVPAVLSAVGMNNDVIEDGVNGYLALSQTDWFNKLSMLIESKELRQKIGLAGRKTIEEKFSSQALSPAYLKLFESVLNE